MTNPKDSTTETQAANYQAVMAAEDAAVLIAALPDESIVDANQPACELYGYTRDELIGLMLSDLGIAGAVARSVQSSHRKKDGTVFVVEISAVRYSVDQRELLCAVVRDVTERMRAEAEARRLSAQTRHKQKLEAIGTLAGGVAHEINNPITGIINYGQMLARQLKGNERLSNYASEIIRESERVARIVRDLLSFARQEETEGHAPARMCDVVDSMLSLMRTAVSKDQIKLEVDVPADLPTVYCHGQQIQQVLMNLVTNARDALNARFPGAGEVKRIHISGRSLQRDGATWVRITVEDYGIGIEPELVDRIFDPFFTTKGPDEGTGLGLSVSHGIIARHGGRLTVVSQPEVMTRFHVDLCAEDRSDFFFDDKTLPPWRSGK